MNTLWQDLRYGLRMLRQNPGFTTVVVSSLALGIRANTTILSFVNALLLRPPSVEEPERLLEVWNYSPKAASVLESYQPLCYPDFVHYRNHNWVFSGLLAFDGDPAFVSWSRAGEGEMVQGQLVSGNFFSVLGVKAVLGRTFFPEEDQTLGTHPVVVLNHAFWQQRLGSDPQVLGKTLTLNGSSVACPRWPLRRGRILRLPAYA